MAIRKRRAPAPMPGLAVGCTRVSSVERMEGGCVNLPAPLGGLWTPSEVSTALATPLRPSEALQSLVDAFRGPFVAEAACVALAALSVTRRAWARAVRTATRRFGRRPSSRELHRFLAERRAVARVGTNGIEAFVSPSYAAFDDDLAFARVVEAIEGSDDPVVRGLVVGEVATGTTTTMRLTSPEGAFEVRDGDVFEPGLIVMNSADGSCPFVIAPASFRRICGNWFLHLRAPCSLRLVHREPRARFDRDLGLDVARTTGLAVGYRHAWRALDDESYAAANVVTDRAKWLGRSTRTRTEAAAIPAWR